MRVELRRGEDNELALRVVAPSRLSLASLFADPRRQAALRLSVPDGWDARYDEASAAWELRCALPTPGDVRVAGLRPEIPAGHALLTLATAGGRMTIPVDVLPEAGPSQRELAEVLTAELGPRDVAISRRMDRPERTTLALTLANRGDTPLVTSAWGPWPPTLTLVVPTAERAPGEGALTTPRRLDDIEVAIERGAGWRVVKRRPGPEWDIVAVPLGGRRGVLEPGERVEVAIRDLATDFAPGAAEVELRSHGFPGFADGVRAFTLVKRAHPMRIAEPLRVATGSRLSWRVEHASLVQLSGVGEVPAAADGFPVAVARDTVVVLTAFDALHGEVLVDQVPVPAGAELAPLPRGTVLAWRGGPVPDGFAPCDGSVEGVPDLRGKFIRGAADEPPPHAHAALRVSVTAELRAAAHSHASPGELVALEPGGEPAAVAGAEEEAHGHAPAALDVAVSFGEAEPVAPRPPWHALAYVMKL